MTPDSIYAELAEVYTQPTQLLVEAAITLGDQYSLWSEYRGNWRAWAGRVRITIRP